MKRIVLFAPLLIFFVMAGFFAEALLVNRDKTKLPSPLINKPLPEFSEESLADPSRLLTQQDLKGKPALLNVWATWCPTCKQEHAQLNKIAQEYGVTIYGINYKDDRVKAQAWLKRYLDPYALNIFDQDGSLGINLGVYGAPETYVLDANGTILYKHIGAVDEKVWQQDLRPKLEQALAEATK